MPDITPADRLAWAICTRVRPDRDDDGERPCRVPCEVCRAGAAAVLRVAVEQVVPDEPGECLHFTNEAIRLNRMGIRAEILARAAELEGHHGCFRSRFD